MPLYFIPRLLASPKLAITLFDVYGREKTGRAYRQCSVSTSLSVLFSCPSHKETRHLSSGEIAWGRDYQIHTLQSLSGLHNSYGSLGCQHKPSCFWAIPLCIKQVFNELRCKLSLPIEIIGTMLVNHIQFVLF